MSIRSRFATVFNQTIAFAEKDIHLQLRFKVNFVVGTFVPALMNIGLFATLYFGFFLFGAPSVAEVDRGNFVAFTLLGSLTATLYSNGFGAFSGRFVLEKYWQTALAVLASPLSPWAILAGVALSEIVKFVIVAVPFIVGAYIFFPVGLGSLGGTLLLLVILYAMVSGISLVRGGLFLVNENVDSIFTFLVVGTGYVSCFYYPIDFLPSFLHVFAEVNPVYYVAYTLRALWLNLPLQPLYIYVSAAAALASLALGTYFFGKVWRNLDLTGY